MNLNKTTKIIIGVLIVSMLAWLVWYILNIKKQVAAPIENKPDVASSTEATNANNDFLQKVKNIEPKVLSENVPIAVAAKRFAERLGSYSLNNKDSDPLYELLPLVTPKAKSAASDYYKKLANKQEPFYGVSSVVVSSKITNVEEAQATVDLSLLQTEQDKAGVKINTYQSNLVVELLKVNDLWMVDSFKWK